MEILSIKGTSQTPEVILDKESGRFQFIGNSLPEDAKSFFEPILSWWDEYVNNPNTETTITFRMMYYNTPSSKLFFQVLKKVEQLAEQGIKATVNWEYADDDPDMKDAGIDYADNLNIPFKFIAYKA
jgi:hypothetical protein